MTVIGTMVSLQNSSVPLTSAVLTWTESACWCCKWDRLSQQRSKKNRRGVLHTLQQRYFS